MNALHYAMINTYYYIITFLAKLFLTIVSWVDITLQIIIKNNKEIII